MKIIKTPIKDLLIIEPEVFSDKRGYFFENYNAKKFREFGLNYNFVQDNESKSSYGVIRGLHYQISPYSQTKLMRVLFGKIFDLGVDLRKNSKTFGKWFGIELSSDDKKQLLIPKGFAHGFSVLSEKAIVSYKCDEFFNKSSERGIKFNDKKLNINWKVPEKNQLISEKDSLLPFFENAEMNF
ncbi:MAG: dTDP-4-dehydrorhamnose 3,5-epimerase [Bacteroidetes bacterium 4572_128]|nr:MAG: dTDP-4-dehydrorhamnose 3,5-epimerase [Bacteroidetes bacterium 4572_128]